MEMEMVIGCDSVHLCMTHISNDLFFLLNGFVIVMVGAGTKEIINIL